MEEAHTTPLPPRTNKPGRPPPWASPPVIPTFATGGVPTHPGRCAIRPRSLSHRCGCGWPRPRSWQRSCRRPLRRSAPLPGWSLWLREPGRPRPRCRSWPWARNPPGTRHRDRPRYDRAGGRIPWPRTRSCPWCRYRWAFPWSRRACRAGWSLQFASLWRSFPLVRADSRLHCAG